jgi:hypothetical protein
MATIASTVHDVAMADAKGVRKRRSHSRVGGERERAGGEKAAPIRGVTHLMMSDSVRTMEALARADTSTKDPK